MQLRPPGGVKCQKGLNFVSLSMSSRLRQVDDDSDEEEAVAPDSVAKDQTDDDQPSNNPAESDDHSDVDSSEDDDDDDEELEKELREGFIADDDDDEPEESESDSNKKKRLKRRRRPRQEETELDEDDLDLVRESHGKRFKRLQRAEGNDLSNMFDDQGSEEERRYGRDDLDDFVEEDLLSDDETRPVSRVRKDKNGKTPLQQLEGLDEDRLQEIYEVFGDGEMYEWALEGEDDEDQLSQEENEEGISLKDVFEPSELAARMLTSEDNEIRATDIPERFQVMRSGLKHGYDLNDEEFAKEVEWVTENIAQEKRGLMAARADLKEPLGTAVHDVLKFIAQSNFEVPFIWAHRQDYLHHDETRLLDLDDLWKVLQYDLDFHALLEREKSTKELWDSLQIESQLFDELFSGAKTLVEFQDLTDWIQYQYAEILKTRSSGEGKRHSRFGHFSRLKSSPVWTEFVAKGGIEPTNFGKNLEAGVRLNEDRDPAESPEELAAATVPGTDATRVLNDATDILAMEMFYDPKVRRYFRKQFLRDAKVDIVLTEDGKKKIDDNSPFYDIKYAFNWGIEELKARPDLYLRMHQAEQQGLVIIRVQYPSYKTTLFENILSDFLASDKSSTDVQVWNDFRRRVLKEVSRRVVPLVSRNIREDLRSDCLTLLSRDVRTSFADLLDQAPYKASEFDAGTVPRVLAVSPGLGVLGKDATVAIVLHEDGTLIESAKFNDPRNRNFAKELAAVVKRTEPDVIGIAGFSVSCNRVKQLIEEAIKEEDLKSGTSEDALQVVWVKDDVARIYQNTTRAATEFVDLPTLGRYCVGLARYMQSPIREYAALGNEVYSLQFNPHQYLLPRDLLSKAIESVFVDYVNLDGIDINLAVREELIANTVRFVAGLGPRKATTIIQALQAKGETVSNRQDFVAFQLMGEKIWVNCASFFRISSEDTGDDGEPLDATRIHPEDYVLARKMAADAMELDEEDIDNDSSAVISDLMNDENIDKLDELVLQDFADSLRETMGIKKLYTLQMIRDELKNPYRELRKPFHELDEKEVFTMLTGESSDSLKAGAVVPAIVRRVNNRQLTLSLSSGVDAIAEAGQITDDRSQPISALFVQGQAVQAAIITVNYRNFFATVNTRGHVVADALRDEKRTRHPLDPQKWNFDAEKQDHQAVQQKAENQQKQSRIIKHPLFRLMNAKQAEEYLAPMQRGDLVIRPSSRGNDHIAITWKVADQIYQHIDVQELDKPNDYTIGKYLQVGKFRYSDLDELIIMHIQAMARKVDEMTQSDKFREGTRADVDKWLTAYTSARPKQSMYAFCFDHKRPGYFLLCFKTGAQQPTQEWHVKVIPNGYELMNNSYPDVRSLSNGFKMIFQNMARRR